MKTTPAQLFEQTYTFIYTQVMDEINWPDAVKAIKNRQAAYTNDNAWSGNVLPSLTCAGGGGEPYQAIPLAAAWILYDLASDIFDDLQDQDGKDRLWNQWETARAMSVGLGLIASANACLAHLQTSYDVLCEILALWARTFALATQGQWAVTQIPTLAQYFSQTVTKSALIYANVAHAGARLSTNENAFLSAMRDYGMALGMIIQIRDDCLDISPGKIKSDLVLGTYTLPVIYALSLNDNPHHTDLCALLDSPEELTRANIDTICCILKDMGAISYSLAIMKAYEQKAFNALTVIHDEQCKMYLENYVSRFTPSTNVSNLA